MSNDVAERTGAGTAVGAPAQNYFTAYGEHATQRTIVGKLLKFTKGDYLAGEENDEVPIGTRFIANMDEFLVGWIRWQDNKPTDHIMGRIATGYQPPPRKELGDDDQSEWEADENGELRDPWQFSNYLLLKRVGDDNKPLPETGDEDDEHIYTFTASSRGGIGALGAVAIKYGKLMRQRPNDWPVIAIGVDSYMHKVKAYGRIKVPMLKIVGWVPKSMFVFDGDDVGGDDVAATEPAQQQLPIDKPPQPTGKARL